MSNNRNKLQSSIIEMNYKIVIGIKIACESCTLNTDAKTNLFVIRQGPPAFLGLVGDVSEHVNHHENSQSSRKHEIDYCLIVPAVSGKRNDADSQFPTQENTAHHVYKVVYSPHMGIATGSSFSNSLTVPVASPTLWFSQ